MDVDYQFTLSAFERDAGNAVCIILLFDITADLIVLVKVVGKIFFACVLLCVPTVYYTHSESVGIDFLTHYLTSFTVSSIAVMWLVLLLMR